MRTTKAQKVARVGGAARLGKQRATAAKAKPITCSHCGCLESAHYAVNYADGPMVSGVTLVCPTSTFLRG